MNSNARIPVRPLSYDQLANTAPHTKELIVDYENAEIYVADGNSEVKKASGKGAANIVPVSSNLETWIKDNGAYVQTVELEYIKASDYPVIDILLPDDHDEALIKINEYKKIYRVTTFDGYIKIYAKNPINIDLNIILKL